MNLPKMQVLEVTWEPDSTEMEYLTGKAFDSLIENAQEIRMLDEHFARRHDFLEELKEDAYRLFISEYSKAKQFNLLKTRPDLFRECVQAVLPIVSDRLYDKAKISRELYKDVASRLSKMMHANRKAKRARLLANPPKRKSYAEMMAHREEQRKQAEDVLLNGTKHGEFYLTGIRAKVCVVLAKLHKNRCKVWPKREYIPVQEQIGSIIAQTDYEVRRRNHMLAFGCPPSD